MKYLDFKETLCQNDPEFDSRLRIEKMQVDLAVAIAQKRESAGLSQSVAAKRAHLTQTADEQN